MNVNGKNLTPYSNLGQKKITKYDEKLIEIISDFHVIKNDIKRLKENDNIQYKINNEITKRFNEFKKDFLKTIGAHLLEKVSPKITEDHVNNLRKIRNSITGRLAVLTRKKSESWNTSLLSTIVSYCKEQKVEQLTEDQYEDVFEKLTKLREIVFSKEHKEARRGEEDKHITFGMMK